MKPTDFYARSVEWLRSQQSLNTDVLPGDRIDDGSGPPRLRGFFARASAASRWAVAGLWAIALGAMLVMTNLPGFTAATRTTVERAGYAAFGLGAGCLAAADVTRRRHRLQAVVELRSAASGPATADSIAALQADALGASAWVVAETELEPDALATAHARGVRCFICDGGHFVEARVRSPDTRVEHA
jgi:hypothetical protein